MANSLATLDSSGHVPATQLPSYVDDVLEFNNFESLPSTGETGKIYVTLNDNKIFRWSGSNYIEISPTAGNADTATKLATARTISMNGDGTWSVSFDGSNNVSGSMSLANTGVAANTYGNSITIPVLSIDSKGRITSASTNTVRTVTQSQSGVMSTADKIKLDGIEAGAEVNVQSDWNQANTSADDFIKNKPTIPTSIGQLSNIPANSVVGNNTASNNPPISINVGENQFIGRLVGENVKAVDAINMYGLSNPTKLLLENASNWDINGQYIGTPISDAKAGQKHYDINYLYEFVTDTTPIRTVRVGGSGGTNIGSTRNGTTYSLTSSTGTGTTLNSATTSLAGVMTASDKTKLDGIQAGAEVNVQSDWNQTDSNADDFIKNKPIIDLEYRVYVVGTQTELVNVSNELVGISGEILFKNNITLNSNITNLNLQNVTINGNGNQLIFNNFN